MTKQDKKDIYDKLFIKPEGEIVEVFNPDDFYMEDEQLNNKILKMDGETIRYFLDWCEGEGIDISKSSLPVLYQQYHWVEGERER